MLQDSLRHESRARRSEATAEDMLAVMVRFRAYD